MGKLLTIGVISLSPIIYSTNPRFGVECRTVFVLLTVRCDALSARIYGLAGSPGQCVAPV